MVKQRLFIWTDEEPAFNTAVEKRALLLKKKTKTTTNPFRLLTSAVKTPHSWRETHYHRIIYTLEEEIYFRERKRTKIHFDEEKHGVSLR